MSHGNEICFNGDFCRIDFLTGRGTDDEQVVSHNLQNAIDNEGIVVGVIEHVTLFVEHEAADSFNHAIIHVSGGCLEALGKLVGVDHGYGDEVIRLVGFLAGAGHTSAQTDDFHFCTHCLFPP